MSAVHGKVIFVDDDESVRMANIQSLNLAGFAVTAYQDAQSALPHINAEFDGVVVSDIRMPEVDGLQFFHAVQEIDPEIPFVLITGHGDVTVAVSALKNGAHDFLTKPFAADHLIASVHRACSMRALLLENRRLQQAADIASRKSPFIGETPAVVRLRDLIVQLARADVDVIVEGESGTGKELVAGMLHRASPRRTHSFVSVTCGWAAPEIVERDLFGDTVAGVTRAKISPIETAHRGTLFLEDADQLPLSAQFRLMRLLDEGILRGNRAGTERPVEIKIIASSNRDLLQAVHAGHFREDLYYRLNTAKLVLPPLRERKADLPLLFAHFVSEALPKGTNAFPDITDYVRRRLIDYDWPGNARELKTFATRFALGLLEDHDIEVATPTEFSLVERVRLYEESLIRDVLMRCSGDVSAALADLKLPRKTFYDKLVRHGIDIGSFRHK
jgi:two-component system C4-dicarboxylate transport response regulator DctD